MHHHFDIISIVAGMPVTSILAYAARTCPMPSNPYGKWLLGIFQYALGNKELGDKNFAPVEPTVK